jgi:hypothetical protein
LFTVTLLCGTTPEEAQLFAKRRQQIAGMTHAQIEQLKHNYEEFRKLSPERQKALEELDDEVRQDSSGRLLKLLTGYNRWLSSLSPFDQERILSKTDPVERAQLVKVIRDEQQKRQALASLDGFGRQALALLPTDLDVMLAAVEENFLTPESRTKVPNRLAGRDRHLRIFQTALQQLHNSSEPAAASQTLVATLVEAIPNETIRSRILNRPPGGQRRKLLGQVLGRSLVYEWRKEIEATFPPPAAIEAEISKRLATASAAKRDQQKTQMNTRQGRRMVGIQILLAGNEQFKELRPVFSWLVAGLPARGGAPRPQPAVLQEGTRTDEAENKAKSAD